MVFELHDMRIFCFFEAVRISARELGYAIVPDSLDDVSYVTRTDSRIIARELGINLYEYFAGTSRYLQATRPLGDLLRK